MTKSKMCSKASQERSVEEQISYDFLRAAREGDVNVVKELFKKYGLLYSTAWSDGYILLREALANGHDDVAKLLLEFGAKVNNNSQYPANTPLHYAAAKGNKEIVDILLSKGARAGFPNKRGETPLHKAVEAKGFHITKLLLWNKAYVNAWTKSGTTPLSIAVTNGDVKITEYLLRWRGKVYYSYSNGSNKVNYTLLHEAADKGFEEIALLLLKKGANVNAKSNHGTPLHLACKHGFVKIVSLLLDNGTEINTVDDMGRNPLHLAAQNGNTEIVQALLINKINVNATSGVDKLTPIVLAAQQKHGHIVKLLLESGADVNALGSNGTTLLGLAVQNGPSPYFIDLILSYSPDLTKDANRRALKEAALKIYGDTEVESFEKNDSSGEQFDSRDEKLLFSAIEKGYVNLTKVLLNYCEDVDTFVNTKTGDDDLMPLHLACKNRQKHIVEELIKFGADVNAQVESEKLNVASKTPIFFSVENNDPDVTKILLSNGANVKKHPKLLYTAIEKQCPELVKMLLQGGSNANTCYRYLNDTQMSRVGAKTITPLQFAIRILNKRVPFFAITHCVPGPKEEIVKLLLRFGADVNACDESGKTPIALSIEQVDLHVTKVLLANNATVDLKNYPNLLSEAIGMKDKAIVEILLEKGTDPNAWDKSTTALHRMAYQYSLDHTELEIAEILLIFGADVNAKTKIGGSPILEYAIEKGHENFVQLLLKFGADVNVRDKFGRTPICQSLRLSRLNITNLLLARIATVKEYPDILPNAVYMRNKTLIENLLEKGADINGRGEAGTALNRIAFLSNHDCMVEIAELLLRSGADVNAKRVNGNTPLVDAIEQDITTIVKVLLDHGADVNATNVNVDLKLKGTALILSASKENHAITEMLLNKGALVNAIVAKCGTSALHMAAAKGQVKIVDVLVKQPDIEIDLVDYYGRTPLHYAVQTNHICVVNLLQRGADINCKDKDGKTPLHYAVGKGNRDTILTLLKHGVVVRCTDNNMKTPVHYAAEIGSNAKISVLLEPVNSEEATVKTSVRITNLSTASVSDNEYETDLINLKDKDGRTALHYAVKGLHKVCVDVLLYYGADINCKDKNGDTPIHYAVTLHENINIRQYVVRQLSFGTNYFGTDRKSILETLVERGAEIDIENNLCKTPLCWSRCAHANSRALAFLLDHGADINTCTGKCKKQTSRRSYDEGISVDILKRHVIKLLTVNKFSVGKENMKVIDSVDLELQTFHRKCKEERALLKEKKVGDSKLTLFDILTRKKNDLTRRLQGKTRVEVSESDFPLYCSLINARLLMLERRYHLLNDANEYFRIAFSIPDLCIDYLTDYLSNEDIKKVIQACQSKTQYSDTGTTARLPFRLWGYIKSLF